MTLTQLMQRVSDHLEDEDLSRYVDESGHRNREMALPLEDYLIDRVTLTFEGCDGSDDQVLIEMLAADIAEAGRQLEDIACQLIEHATASTA